MKILTWNLYHGRAEPPAGRDLLPEFSAMLAIWDWDVALLQEVPPWWPVPLARASGASARMALTSRNELLPLRRWVAERWPDLIKSGGGGCNAILVRGQRITEHRRALLRWRPERRVVHGVRLQDGTWMANVHAQVRPHTETRKDLARTGAVVLGWSGDAPAVVGGDLNIPHAEVPGFTHLGGRGVDHVLGRGFAAVGRRVVPDRGPLSDHPPVLVTVHREQG
ncbi:MAG: endonuclease/exonuclease/phosphatase family protein [Solirubrobacteraceae bacterium]